MQSAVRWSADAVLRTSRMRHATSQMSAPSHRRRLHTPIGLHYEVAEGMGKFMSPETLHMVAIEYQKGLLDRLNDEVRGDPELEKASVFSQVQALALRQDKALAFNYASQALNNSFFLDMITPPRAEIATESELSQTEQQAINTKKRASEVFLAQVEADFGSLPGLKSSFSAAAMGMMGSGWIWLVRDKKGRLAVAATYGSGTMLIRSRANLGPKEWADTVSGSTLGPQQSSFATRSPYDDKPGGLGFNSSRPASPPSWGSARPRPGAASPVRPNQTIAQSQSRPMSSIKALDDVAQSLRTKTTPYTGPQAGTLVTPLLVCSIHEHCWLHDHGIWGKETYLESFWDVVDWRKLEKSWEEARTIATRKHLGE